MEKRHRPVANPRRGDRRASSGWLGFALWNGGKIVTTVTLRKLAVDRRAWALDLRTVFQAKVGALRAISRPSLADRRKLI
jgi:hypothetical protein